MTPVSIEKRAARGAAWGTAALHRRQRLVHAAVQNSQLQLASVHLVSAHDDVAIAVRELLRRAMK